MVDVISPTNLLDFSWVPFGDSDLAWCRGLGSRLFVLPSQDISESS